MTNSAPAAGANTATDGTVGIARQAEAYRAAVLAHLEPGQPCCIVGFPEHDNSGDAAIYLGEVKLFDEIGSDIAHVCSRDNYTDDIEAHYPEGPVFLHGGGNFGDLYKENWMRRRVLRHYHGRKIVQLPQTLHFQRQEGVDEMKQAISDHGDFHLMVRDIPSHTFANEHFDCPVTLVPDAAYYLARIAAPRTPKHDVVIVQRTDEERASDPISDYLKTLGPVRDWQGKTAPWSHFLAVAEKKFRSRILGYRTREATDMAFRERAYRKRAQRRLHVAVDLLSRARFPVSDRLHAHIISSLMRKPHVALDNSYGKISGYIDAWGNDGLALTARTRDELQAAVAHHLSGAVVPPRPGTGWEIRDQ